MGCSVFSLGSVVDHKSKFHGESRPAYICPEFSGLAACPWRCATRLRNQLRNRPSRKARRSSAAILLSWPCRMRDVIFLGASYCPIISIRTTERYRIHVNDGQERGRYGWAGSCDDIISHCLFPSQGKSKQFIPALPATTLRRHQDPFGGKGP